MNIRNKRYELLKKSKALQDIAIGKEGNFEIRKLQDETHKKWEFYDKFIKANIELNKQN